jgi:Bacterial regulatory protein, Fis family
LRALRATEGKRARTAELLGISRKTLWEKLRVNEARNNHERTSTAPWAAATPPSPPTRSETSSQAEMGSS